MSTIVLGDLLPVGTILHSMLTLAQFQAVSGSGWVLADGSSCTGTKYASITSATTLPDMRGRVIRGKDAGSGHNPDGDTALGTYQADTYASHNHTLTDPGHTHSVSVWTGSTPSASPIRPVADQFTTSNSVTTASNTTGITLAASGGNETRMKNVTANIFIKVN